MCCVCLCFVFHALLLYFSTFLLSYFSTFLHVYCSTFLLCLVSACVLSVCLLSVWALFVLKGAPPLLRRANDVCPLLRSYVSINLGMYLGYLFLDVGYLLDYMFAPFSIVLASLFRALFSIRCSTDVGKDLMSV